MKIVGVAASIFYKAAKKNPPHEIKKILFLKIGAMGDILMTTPLVRCVKKKFPEAKIDYACGRTFADVLRNNPNIDSVIKFDENIFFHHKIHAMKKLAEQLKKNNYDAVFVLDKHWGIAVFASFIRAFQIGFDRDGEGFANNASVKYSNIEHEIKQYLKLGKIIKAVPCGHQIDLNIPKKDEIFAERILMKLNEKAISIAPGGTRNPGESTLVRRWPSEKWAVLAERLAQKYYVIILGGKSDYQLGKEIEGHAKTKKIINMAGKCTIQQSAAIMKRCKWVICVDSGPMHIASAVNRHIIALFGPSNPKRKMPLHPESIAIWKDRDIYEHDYDFRGRQPKNRNFMKRITVEDVLARIA